MNSLLMRIDFALGGQSKVFQAGHWGDPEANFTWALAPTASVRLPWPDDRGVLGILLELTPALDPPKAPSRALTVIINREYRFDCRLFRTDTILLKWDASVRLAPDIQIELLSGDPPGTAGDDRKLTFAIHRICLIGLGNPASPAVTAVSPVCRFGNLGKTIKAATDSAGASIQDVMAAFESLGGSCDYGELQRLVGVDPLGLLRFGGVDISGLVRGCLDRFDKLSAARTDDIEVSIKPGDAYFVVEKHYGIGWHTLVPSSQASPEQIAAREAWRLPLLRRKFVETIEEAEKIFILRRSEGLLREQADAVVETLRLLSDCTVLWLEHSDTKVGEVESLSAYLMKGYLDVLGIRGNSSHEAWVNVCANAYRLARPLAHARDQDSAQPRSERP